MLAPEETLTVPVVEPLSVAASRSSPAWTLMVPVLLKISPAPTEKVARGFVDVECAAVVDGGGSATSVKDIAVGGSERAGVVEGGAVARF